MIASPTDVNSERDIIRTEIYEWNAVHSMNRHLVLIPVGWDTHAAPEMGDRPQALINKQVLHDCDLLVAVFWTRLGSPTGKAPSGTAEEIEKHLKAGKPAMLYFSNAPISPDRVDNAQYSALQEFRNSCEQKGIIETYKSPEEFREKFSRQLTQTIIRLYGNLDTPQLTPNHLPAPSRPLLSDTAKQLLIEAAQDSYGTVICIRMRSGLHIETNGKQLAQMDSPRSEAIWKGAINELTNEKLLEARGHKGETFALTNKGYEVADQLAHNAT
jgi:hypothetical protein